MTTFIQKSSSPFRYGFIKIQDRARDAGPRGEFGRRQRWIGGRGAHRQQRFRRGRIAPVGGQGFIERAKASGAKVLTGGGVPAGLDRGYYVEPTIVSGLPRNHRLFKEEMFVPILCVADFEEFGDAVAMANDVDYGLTAGIFTGKQDEVKEFLDCIEAGVVYVNRQASATTGAMVGCQPFGGWKDSGTTGKGTGGPHYLTQFMREQSQTVAQG